MNIFQIIKRMDAQKKKKIQIGSITLIAAIIILWAINSLLTVNSKTLEKYYLAGDYHKVIELGKEYVKNNPKDIQALNLLSISMLRTAKESGKLDTKIVNDTITLLKSSYKINANNSEISKLIGNAYFMLKNYPVAKAFYIRSDAESKETNIGAILGIGRVHLATGLFLPAENEFKRAQKLDPNYPDVILALAEIQLKRGKFDQVLSMLRPIIESEEIDIYTKSLANQTLGLSYLALKKYKDAEASFTLALNVNSSLTSSLIGKAQAILYMMPTATYASVAEYTELPKKLAEQALLYEENNIYAYNVLTQINLLRKDKASAKTTAQKAVDLSKTNTSLTSTEKKQIESMLKFAETDKSSVIIKSIKVIKK